MATSITLVTNSSTSEYTLATGGRGPIGATGATGAPGSSVAIDATIIDGSANAVSGNAVFDALALKAPTANPTFTGIVTAPRITGRCDGLEVLCKAGLAINAGQVVYVTGASGANIIIGLAQANAELTSSKTIGISQATLANNETGYVITEGLLTVSISAPTANEGDPIWLSPSTAGGMVFGVANKPVSPNHMVYLGVVTRKTGNTVVEIYVKIQNGSELDELADVLIVDAAEGQALMRGATSWQNRSLVSTDISDSLDTSPEAIHHFYDQLINFSVTEYPGDGKYVVIGAGGDSMGTNSGFPPYVALEMIRRFGQGCVGTSALVSGIAFGTGQQTTTVTLAGSATVLTTTFTYLPNGEYYSLPIGGSVTEIAQSANIHAGWTKVRCWFGRKSGGGTLTFTVSQYGTPITAKTADTGAGTAGTIGYVDFDVADGLLKNGKPTLVVTNATGVSHYLGCYMYLGSGVIPVTLGQGGSSYAQALSSTAANLATFCTAMDTRLIFHAVKEEDADLSDLSDMMDRWYAQHPNCSHVWVGNTSSPSGDGGLDVTTNAAMRAKCATYKWAFVDGQKLLRTVAYLGTIGSEANGWNESAIAPHLTIPARRFIAAWIIDKLLLNLQVPGGRFNLYTAEAAAMGVLSDTTTRATIWAQTSSAIGATNFTQSTNPDMGKMTYQFTASPAPVANTGRAGKFMDFGPQMGQRQIYKYRLFDGNLLDDIRAVILVGGASQNEAVGMTNTSWNGFRIIHGVDVISSQSVPYIQFAVKGSGTSETVSPKIYHSTTTAAAPYGGGSWFVNTDNIYWVEYIGNGTSTTKRFRAWHQPAFTAGSTTRLPARRMIADWSGTITVGGLSDSSTYFALITGASPATPGGVRECWITDVSVEIAPKFVTDYSQQNLNY